MSNIVDLPDIVDYPEFFKFSENKPLFENKYCYVIEPYNLNNGICLFVGFRDGFVLTRMGNFTSHSIDMNTDKIAFKILNEYQPNIVNVLKSSRIANCLIYFSKVNNDIVLVDAMVSANKFVGPGMLRDLFGKIIKTQEVIAIEVMSPDNLNKYKGKFIKPSSFKCVIENDNPRPLYGVIDEI